MDKLPPDEIQKIGSMLRDNSATSTSWMYEQPKKEAEDFLLGKVVKSLEELAEISRDQTEETPAQRLTRLDMQAKFREDPLNLMRQHEFDKRSALLQNTAKMKKLKRLIEQQKHQHQKKLKKKRGKDKHSRKTVSSSSSSDSDDDGILDKFISIVQQSENVNTPESPTDKCAANDQVSDEKRRKKHHRHHKSRHHHRSRSKSSSIKEHEPSPSRHQSIPASIKSLQRPAYRDAQFPEPPQPRRSREEMAALRAQMAADADDRQQERSKRFESHKLAKSQQETEEMENKKKFGASFLKGMTLSHVSNSSVEESIQRRASSRQTGDMNGNFLSK